MVTDYLKSCRYKYDKLKNHIYIITGSDNIIIDKDYDSQYYISGVDLSNIVVVSGFNISFTEEDSLDERYKFQKTLKISVNGKVDTDTFSGDIYAVIETYDDTKYLVNPDFPLKFTYQFNLSEGTNQSDITLQTLSNMPTLEFIGDGFENTPECKHYALNGISELYMIEAEKAVYVSTDNSLKLTSELNKVEFNDYTCSLQEIYDGEKVTDTIKFDISFDYYKTSWQYRLLEFKENLYRAVVFAKDKYKYYVGFNTGLQPSYSINSSSSDFNTVTVTLIESSLLGCFNKYDVTNTVDTSKTWEYIRILGENNAYYCNMSHGCGMAEIIVMAEVDAFGNQTGRYKVEEDIYNGLYNQTDPDIDYSWFDDNFGWLRRYNVVGYFEDDYPNGWFPTVECICYNPHPSVGCQLTTDMPFDIEFEGTGSTSYTFEASCSWEISEIPSGITISPTSGIADSAYTISIANSSNDLRQVQFKLTCCRFTYIFAINVVEAAPCIEETSKQITCEGQTVQFKIKDGCEFVIASLPTGLLANVSNNILYVNVPANGGQSSKTYYINGTCCGNAVTLQISQNPPVNVWLEDGYTCSGGTKYVKETLWTGTTVYDIVKTAEYRLGEELEQDSPDCRSIESYKFIGYVCIDGAKYELLRRFISWDDGETWIEQDEVKLGEFIEADSSFCEQEISYKWVLNENEWVCMDL